MVTPEGKINSVLDGLCMLVGTGGGGQLRQASGRISETTNP